ncbi:MAG: MaoC family dehydratase [Proteobacteria bacterium]|nr:MaoC family dehydratase [Pseudomonadota bacterium]
MTVEDRPELVFADLGQGRTFRPFEMRVTGDLAAAYMDTVGDRNPLYFDAGAAGPGGPIAPPGLAAIYARSSYLQDHAMPSGGVLAKQEFEFLAPVRVGDTLRVQARVFESYLDDKGRRRVHFLIEAENQDGRPVTTIRLYAIWPK